MGLKISCLREVLLQVVDALKTMESMRNYNEGQCGCCGEKATEKNPIPLCDDSKWITLCRSCARQKAAIALAAAKQVEKV